VQILKVVNENRLEGHEASNSATEERPRHSAWRTGATLDQLLVSCQVVGGSAKYVRSVSRTPEQVIAGIAQQLAHFAGLVAVVNVEPFRTATRLSAFTDRAAPTLRAVHSIVLLRRYAVFSLQVARPSYLVICLAAASLLALSIPCVPRCVRTSRHFWFLFSVLPHVLAAIRSPIERLLFSCH